MSDCPSAAHGTNRDPYGCYERERATTARIDRAVESALAVSGRRLADRLLDAGTLVAREYAQQDRLDPDRPPLSVLVAETLANHERIGEERVLARVRALIEQRTALCDDRVRVAGKYLDEGNLQAAASETRWATAVAEQIAVLRLLLIEPTGEQQ